MSKYTNSFWINFAGISAIKKWFTVFYTSQANENDNIFHILVFKCTVGNPTYRFFKRWTHQICMQFLYIRFPMIASAFKNWFFVFVDFLNVYILEHQCTAGIPVNNCIWKFIFPQETYSCLNILGTKVFCVSIAMKTTLEHIQKIKP